MRYIHTQESLTIPENGELLPASFYLELRPRSENWASCRRVVADSFAVKIHIKSRVVTVEGPRGQLQIEEAT